MLQLNLAKRWDKNTVLHALQQAFLAPVSPGWSTSRFHSVGWESCIFGGTEWKECKIEKFSQKGELRSRAFPARLRRNGASWRSSLIEN